jgi:hypothetical protein
MKVPVSLIFLLLTATLFGAGSVSAVEGKFGYLHENPHNYRFGVIDKSGSFVISPTYSDIQNLDSGGRAIVWMSTPNTIPGFILKLRMTDGSLLPKEEDLAALSLPTDGQILCHWKDSSSSAKNYSANKRLGMTFCSEGGQVMDLDVSLANRFSDGVAVVSTKDRHIGFLDKDGKLFFKSTELDFPVHSEFSEGLLAVSHKGGLWGYLDKSGKWKIDPLFKDARDFCNGFGVVQLADAAESANSLTYLDGQGKRFDKCFNAAENFAEGVAAAAVWKKNTQSESGRVLWGLVDTQGNWVVKPKYLAIGPLCDGLRTFLRYDSNHYGFIDNAGREVISPQYNKVSGFSEGVCAVLRPGSGKIEFVDKRGKVVCVPSADGVNLFPSPVLFRQLDLSVEWPRFRDGLCRMPGGDWPNLQWGYIDKTGKWAIKPQFRVAEDFRDGRAVVGLGSK